MPGRLGPFLASLDRFSVFTSHDVVTAQYIDGLPRAVVAQYSGLEGDTALSAGLDMVQGTVVWCGRGVRPSGVCSSPPRTVPRYHHCCCRRMIDGGD